MRLLIDENVNAAVDRWLVAERPRLWIERVTDALGVGASDVDIANYADLMRAIVVTENHADFRVLISRRPTGNRQARRHAGRISLCCGAHAQARRIEQLIDVIEAEDRRSRRSPDTRVIMEIHGDYYRVDR